VVSLVSKGIIGSCEVGIMDNGVWGAQYGSRGGVSGWVDGDWGKKDRGEGIGGGGAPSDAATWVESASMSGQ